MALAHKSARVVESTTQSARLTAAAPSLRSVRCIRLAQPAGPRAGRAACRRAQLLQITRAVNAPTRPGTSRPAQPSGNAKRTGDKKTVIVTGASSGLGLSAAKHLAKSGDYHVIMAVRDYSKAAAAAKRLEMPRDSFTIMHLDLASLDSVRDFVDNFRATGRPLDVVVCNAAVYLPTAKEPTFTADGFELSVGTNHLGHFLLANLLLEDMKKNPASDKRMIIVGSITGNTNTLAGNVPPKANLGDLSGLERGLSGRNDTAMIDNGEFDGAKAYKDSKVCNMLTMREMHKRFHKDTGITFSSLYPGCIAETGLFRSHYGLFKKLFPPFQKYITKGYVSEDEAGLRLSQVVSSPNLKESGVYWSWSRETGSFQNQVSEEVSDDEKARRLWEVANHSDASGNVQSGLLPIDNDSGVGTGIIHQQSKDVEADDV